MTILGIILLVLGFVLAIKLLWILGLILLVLGLIFLVYSRSKGSGWGAY